jgi:hypothetical protein
MTNPEREKKRIAMEHGIKGLEYQKIQLGIELSKTEEDLKSFKARKEQLWNEINILEETIAETRKRLQDLLAQPEAARPEITITPDRPPKLEDKVRREYPDRGQLTKIDSLVHLSSAYPAKIYQEVVDDIIKSVKYSDWFAMNLLWDKLGDRYSKTRITHHVLWMLNEGRMERNDAKSGPSCRYRLVESLRGKIEGGTPFSGNGEKMKALREAEMV